MKTTLAKYFAATALLIVGFAGIGAFTPAGTPNPADGNRLSVQKFTTPATAADTVQSSADSAILYHKLTHADSLKRLAIGAKYYSNICSVCHGDDGNGDGPTAMFFKVKPRDFVRAQYKFRSTASGQLPLDEDIYGTITGGLPTTAMPPFAQMDPQVVTDLVMYLKSLSPRFADPVEYPLDTVKIGMPIPYTSESIRRGRFVYIKAKCWNCHGIQGKGDGPAVDQQFDDKGNRLYTDDLTNAWDKKVGFTPELVFKIFSTGLNGTTMPSYSDALTAQERWDLANYTIALSDRRKPYDALEIPPEAP